MQNNEFKGLEFVRSEDVLVTMPGLGSIGCHVDSNPLPHDFRWGFRSSKKEENSRTTTNPTGKPKVSVKNLSQFHSAYLHYEMDYGSFGIYFNDCNVFSQQVWFLEYCLCSSEGLHGTQRQIGVDLQCGAVGIRRLWQGFLLGRERHWKATTTMHFRGEMIHL